MNAGMKAIRIALLFNFLMMPVTTETITTSVGMPDNETVVVMNIVMNEDTINNSSDEKNLKESISFSLFRVVLLCVDCLLYFFCDLFDFQKVSNVLASPVVLQQVLGTLRKFLQKFI